MDSFKSFHGKKSKDELIEYLRGIFQYHNELSNLLAETLEYPRDDDNGPYQGGFIIGHLELEDLVQEIVIKYNELRNQK